VPLDALPPGPAGPFAFRDPGPLADGELTLVLDYRSPSDPARGWVPAYHFALRVGGRRVGGIELRVGRGAALERDAGHLGYFVDPAWRGRGYAARAARLLLPLARAHGLDPLWVTCDPHNAASRRTCERIGAVLVEVTPSDTPAAHGVAVRAARAKCCYRLDLGPPCPPGLDPRDAGPDSC
jgi:tagatose 1,6-diphosphate aldolase